MKEVQFPKYLSRPMLFLFFETDDFMVFMMPFSLLSLFDFDIVFTLVLSVIVAVVYVKNKEKLPRGILYHIYYVLGGRWKGFNSVFIREYKE